MKRLVPALLAGGLLVLFGTLLGQIGLLSISGPSLPRFTDVEVDVSLPEEARIVAIEPISLDCRARVHALVPVVGTREHEAFGAVYRTDRVTLDAIGDVDTCVDGNSARIEHHRDGTTEVIIPGESIVFVRPRVDTVATGDSLTVSRGLIGKLTDAFPWVDDNLGLTPLAYAYAQNVIGSSQCMQTAYTVTERMLVDAYRQQFIEQGVDPAALTVHIDGEPLFAEPAVLDMAGVDLRVGDGEVRCVASDDLGGVSRSSDL
ncbi:MAG: hypothetical protein OEV40_10545 [Acidimicrobiia bacterium]|nr:hypothetical protein [Acidimicrobiia bacterium]